MDTWQNIAQDVRAELNVLAAAADPADGVETVIVGLNCTVQQGTPKYSVQVDKVRIRVPLQGRTQWLKTTSPTPVGVIWDPSILDTLQFNLPVTAKLPSAIQGVMVEIALWIKNFHAEVNQHLKYWTRELEALLQAKVEQAVDVAGIMGTLGFEVDAIP